MRSDGEILEFYSVFEKELLVCKSGEPCQLTFLQLADEHCFRLRKKNDSPDGTHSRHVRWWQYVLCTTVTLPSALHRVWRRSQMTPEAGCVYPAATCACASACGEDMCVGHAWPLGVDRRMTAGLLCATTTHHPSHSLPSQTQPTQHRHTTSAAAHSQEPSRRLRRGGCRACAPAATGAAAPR